MKSTLVLSLLVVLLVCHEALSLDNRAQIAENCPKQNSIINRSQMKCVRIACDTDKNGQTQINKFTCPEIDCGEDAKYIPEDPAKKYPDCCPKCENKSN